MLVLLCILAIAFPEIHTSFYGASWNGRVTASGTVFNAEEFTCASPTLPFGTHLLLKTAHGHAWVEVTDRGPYAVDSTGHPIMPLRPHPTREIDLAQAPFEALFPTIDIGVGKVYILRVKEANTMQEEKLNVRNNAPYRRPRAYTGAVNCYKQLLNSCF
jgi:rare lipoprotein A (peptidoglycan hydrolase)